MANAIQQAKDAFSGFVQRFNVPKQIAAIPSWISNTVQQKQNFLPEPGYMFSGVKQSSQIDKSYVPGTAQYKMLNGEGYVPRMTESARMAGPLFGPNSRKDPFPGVSLPGGNPFLPRPPQSQKAANNVVADMPIKKVFPVAAVSPKTVPGATMKDKPWAKTIEPDQRIIDEITKGYEKYKASQGHKGTLPAINQAPVFAEYAQRFPIYQQNPYLMPAVAIYETSGGLNVTRPTAAPKDLINYGVRVPAIQRLFARPEMTQEEVLRRALYEMATSRSSVFRGMPTDRPLNADELAVFADRYEPNNGSYFHNLSSGLRDYWQQPY